MSAVILGVPTIVSYDLLDRLLESAVYGSVTPTGYIIVDNGGSYGRARADAIVGRGQDVTVELVRPEGNLGVAASWNRILELAGEEPIVISNDDVVLGVRTFGEMSSALERALFVSGDGWALFGQRPQCTRLVGAYDENIWPAYYEDVDYDIRLRWAGITPVRPLSEPLRHDGWTTTRRLRDSPWLAEGRERNRRYVIAKWGADWVGGASYREPFDGHPPAGWSEKR